MIETERLLLRPLTDDDIDDAHRELYSDPEVTWSGRTFSREEAVEGIASKRRHFEGHGFGMLAVTDKATGELFGWGGLQYMEGGPEVELGYYLARKAWGKGYATELARPFMELAFTRLGLERVVAVVRPGNKASKNVLAKAGFSFVAHEHHYDEDVELWEARPDSASDAAVAATGAMTEALETLERARGHLYAFHQLVGEADLKLDEVLDQLRANGSNSLAEIPRAGTARPQRHRRALDLPDRRGIRRRLLDDVPGLRAAPATRARQRPAPPPRGQDEATPPDAWPPGAQRPVRSRRRSGPGLVLAIAALHAADSASAAPATSGIAPSTAIATPIPTAL